MSDFDRGRANVGWTCAACGRLEVSADARFCGSCGGPLVPATAARADTSELQHAPALSTALHRTSTLASGGNYAVPYMGYIALAKVGAGVAALVWLFPCFFLAVFGTSAVHYIRTTLDVLARQQARVPVVGVDLPLNFVTLLRLEALHRFSIYWDDRLAFLFAAVWLAPWAGMIIGGAVFAVAVALVYNVVGKVSGGVQVRLDPLP